jgi:hypothetical protein
VGHVVISPAVLEVALKAGYEAVEGRAYVDV